MRWFKCYLGNEGPFFTSQGTYPSFFEARISPADKGHDKGAKYILTVQLTVEWLGIWRHWSTTYHQSVEEAMEEADRTVAEIRDKFQAMLDAVDRQSKEHLVTSMSKMGQYVPLSEDDSTSPY